ncbi:SDR family oxidoreductase [Desulfofundulus sp. TPOSR]|uniref:3-oxoacyl-(Acyl-carrier-protein) reductase n=1 Tax=Desulfofundulus kuznetsovii (strain DSM 6115 / VKM B-1805 / 17) TaxID=760568 RepID=A0AAU8PUZ2_DESK7|nr:SDR family NAD(P)-dependent oxidoreductase [Desulfofundulus sp. TPOSR]AEG16046.1 3-oxoacyl-(acyl-carrier-protein) reductase [Desulfofundulus kuznetsovii DSM 6115]NHM27455.1 SDR family oxidoreductase [Desulfofundulus sp. TPOSR]
MKLKDKVALITGGTAGLGRGIALAFAREGAKVAISGRNEERLQKVVQEIEALGAEALGIRADVSSSQEVKNMFARLLERFGTIDILVNNAGIFRSHEAGVKDRMRHLDLVTTPVPRHSLQITRNMSDEEWQRMFEVNVNGVFYCTREALKIMEDKGYGRIINIASIAGISAMSSHSPNYSAAKGAVVAFTKSVAHEVAGAGICVNCIAPGYIETETFMRGINQMSPERRNRLMQWIPVGRIGKIEEYASLAVYLASDDAGYMIGQVISPNGGLYI